VSINQLKLKRDNINKSAKIKEIISINQLTLKRDNINESVKIKKR
jgi:hypothetical protein